MKRLGMIWSAALALTLGACLLLAPGNARAQSDPDVTPELSRDWTVRVGIFVPQSQTTRSVNGEVGVSGFVERRVYDGNNYEVQIGIGYNGFDRVYNIPATISLILKRGDFRLGGGVGYGFGKRLDGRGTQGSVLSVIAGYQLTHGRTPITGDLRYYFLGGSDNELDGLAATLGIKF